MAGINECDGCQNNALLKKVKSKVTDYILKQIDVQIDDLTSIRVRNQEIMNRKPICKYMKWTLQVRLIVILKDVIHPMLNQNKP
jgi:hypothetical protein